MCVLVGGSIKNRNNSGSDRCLPTRNQRMISLYQKVHGIDGHISGKSIFFFGGKYNRDLIVLLEP